MNPSESNLSRSVSVALSVYGYGMMSFGTAVAALLVLGYFTDPSMDPFYAWGISIFAGATGALALAMVRVHFLRLKSSTALILATIFNVFLFGCYFTVYQGTSRIYAEELEPFALDPQAVNGFWQLLRLSWMSACLGAIFCTMLYFMIHRSCAQITETIDAAETPPQGDPGAG